MIINRKALISNGNKLGLIVLLCTLFVASEAYAERLLVGIPIPVNETIPDKVKQIKAALLSTGLEFEFRELPLERSMLMLKQGTLAIDIYRQSRAMAGSPELTKVEPEVDKHDFWMATHIDTPDLCLLSTKQHLQRSVVGIRGARMFESMIYPNFKFYEEVNSLKQAIIMVNLERVDFTIWPLFGLHKLQKELGINLYICKKRPYLTMKFFSYIHKDYLWALPKIIAAYKKEFTLK